jgi:hypothetical protein
MDDLLDELEEAQQNDTAHLFKSRVSQPTLISLSSANAVQTGSSGSFSKLSFELPRPALNIDTIQLVEAVIPQCVPSLPDNSLVFWYYRLSEYSGKVPNSENLYFVRLLPSYYKPEFIQGFYGQNKTFNTYQDLATSLVSACSQDLALDNLNYSGTAGYDVRFLPNEISLPYNATYNKFQMVGTSATLQLAYKQYSGATAYLTNDVVFFGSLTYVALVPTTGVTPGTNPAVWKRVNAEIVAPYSATTPYGVGRYVRSANLLYKSILASTGIAVSNTTYWTQIIEAQQINYRYLIAGYTDPNLVQPTYRPWNPYALFESGAIVRYKGIDYSANYQNVGSAPPSAAWSVSGVAPLITALKDCSPALDMYERGSFDSGSRLPFPEGVPGQQTTKRRTLASLMGFTWNGIMTPSLLANIQPQSYLNYIATENTLLYNRLRPVPLYTTSLGSGLGLPTSIATQTYTAEGYCNLVYSSIIHLYATIVGGSTLNTEQNTNLLATGTMSCGNLGVSFFNALNDNPLPVFGDLYSVGIEMKDENNDPYELTNNAVVSLVLKIRYRNGLG